MAVKVITGCFENGVIIPGQKIKVRNHQKVTIIIPGGSGVSEVAQVAKKVKGGLPHETIEQIIESTEVGEGID